MIALTLADVARITAGRLAGAADGATIVAGPIVTDSRQVVDGALFFCLRGEHVDGHDYAAAAVAAGAVAAVADRPVDAPSVVVADTESALGALAGGVLAKTGTRVVGVTGSSGKTSTKDLLAAVFGAAGETVAPAGSFNNEIGLPLTVLRVTASTQTLVLEYSARGTGHIRYLCGIAQPDVGIVLNVGAAHLGEFGSRDAIARAKGELVEALPAGGVAVLNADDPLVAAMAGRTAARVVTFGAGADADVRVSGLVTDDFARPRFTLTTPSGSAPVRLGLSGAHHASNAAAVVAAATAAGISLSDAVSALEQVAAISPHRMQLRETDDGIVVIDDAYNANPDSMRAALRALTSMAAGRRRTWAVLGVMRELGPDAPALHAEVGAEAATLGVDELVVVGADAAPIADGAAAAPGWAGRARCATDVDEATALLRREVRRDDVVLVKASNSEQLWRVADLLARRATAEVNT